MFGNTCTRIQTATLGRITVRTLTSSFEFEFDFNLFFYSIPDFAWAVKIHTYITSLTHNTRHTLCEALCVSVTNQSKQPLKLSVKNILNSNLFMSFIVCAISIDLSYLMFTSIDASRYIVVRAPAYGIHVLNGRSKNIYECVTLQVVGHTVLSIQSK